MRSRNVTEQFTKFGASGAVVVWTLDLASPRGVAPGDGTLSRTMTIEDAASALLILLPIAFNAFFFLLARLFDYPAILRSPTASILSGYQAQECAGRPNRCSNSPSLPLVRTEQERQD